MRFKGLPPCRLDRGEGSELTVSAMVVFYWTTPIFRLVSKAEIAVVFRNKPELSATGLNDLRHLRRINW